MKTIQIRGIIVDAWYDHAYFEPEIAAGIITPSSRFVRDLRTALDADAEPVEVAINSTGGDVFAGGEMLAAIQDAGNRVARISVGGIAASMAANIALMAARPLAVHTNSLMYFHSATSEIWGGPGAHADEAGLLDRVNAPMIARLKEAGVPAGRVDEGFRDGRNMVLGADECAEYLGAEVIGAAAAQPPRPDADALGRLSKPSADLERLAEHTASLAAVARLAAWAPDAAQDAPETGAGADAAPDGEPPANEPQGGGNAASGDTPPSHDAPDPVASLEKQLRAVQSAAGRKIHELQTSLAAAEQARDAAQARLADLEARLADLTAALAAERTARADLVGEVLAPESDTEAPAGATPHADRLASLRSLDERVAYAREHAAELAAERRRRA